ncbi:hypothetical protein C8F04DRAFT_228735 [Mycena alexandri]|uniref:Uncharacterized protein n=1 Tax=Mycena alexandri TaxID=1745969 RepID=A0AAD6T8I6_9AGAR|nr:hypothetical protein C8F04DRAFT_228735 [Mycena alexandri]
MQSPARRRVSFNMDESPVQPPHQPAHRQPLQSPSGGEGLITVTPAELAQMVAELSAKRMAELSNSSSSTTRVDAAPKPIVRQDARPQTVLMNPPGLLPSAYTGNAKSSRVANLDDKSQLRADDLVVPAHIQTILKAGWVKWFALSDLKPENCAIQNKANIDADQQQFFIQDGGLFAKDVERNSKADDHLSSTDLIIVLKRLASCCEKYFVPAEPARGKKLCMQILQLLDNLLDHGDLKDNIHRYRAYVLEVLTRFVHGDGFDLSIWQTQIWERVVDLDRDRAVRRQPPPPSPPRRQRNDDYYGGRGEDDHRGRRDTGRRGERRDDNNNRNEGGSRGGQSFRNEGAPRGGQSFRGEEEERRGGRGGRKRITADDIDPKCIFCGATNAHSSYYCPNSKGKWCVRSKSGRGWQPPIPNLRICWHYNRPDGCDKDCGFTHACSLCGAGSDGARSHAAQRCTTN